VKTEQSITGPETSIWCASSLPISVVGKKTVKYTRLEAHNLKSSMNWGLVLPLRLHSLLDHKHAFDHHSKRITKTEEWRKAILLSVDRWRSYYLYRPFRGQEDPLPPPFSREKREHVGGESGSSMDMPQRWWWWCITQILSYSSSYVDNWSLSLFVDQPSRAWFAPASPFGHIDNGGGQSVPILPPY